MEAGHGVGVAAVLAAHAELEVRAGGAATLPGALREALDAIDVEGLERGESEAAPPSPSPGPTCTNAGGPHPGPNRGTAGRTANTATAASGRPAGRHEHRRVALTLELNTLDHCVPDLEQPLPYPCCAHAVPRSLVSVPRQARNLDGDGVSPSPADDHAHGNGRRPHFPVGEVGT